MSEKELDSSVNEYEEEYKSSNYVKQLQWDMAIGLQEVDNLKPSKYLEKLLEENVEGNLTIEEVEKELREYYIEKENKNEINHNELELSGIKTTIDSGGTGRLTIWKNSLGVAKKNALIGVGFDNLYLAYPQSNKTVYR